METYTELKSLVNNPHFPSQREKALGKLRLEDVDTPVRDMVRALNGLECCYSLQCCYGHFVYEAQKDSRNLASLPAAGGIAKVEYRIAYLALCVQNSDAGQALLEKFEGITQIDPQYVQFGCAEWFWNQCVNSYALQVEPERHKAKDSVVIGLEEALHIERVRNEVFGKLGRLLKIKEGGQELETQNP